MNALFDFGLTLGCLVVIIAILALIVCHYLKGGQTGVVYHECMRCHETIYIDHDDFVLLHGNEYYHTDCYKDMLKEKNNG